MNTRDQIEYWAHMLDESGVGGVAIPSPDDAGGKKAIKSEINRMFGGDAYEYFVPDEYAEMEGERRDLDEWDEWKVNRQHTIDEQYFWDLVEEAVFDEYDAGSFVPEGDFAGFLKDACSAIAERAWNEYTPSEAAGDRLVYRGRDKGWSYWH